MTEKKQEIQEVKNDGVLRAFCDIREVRMDEENRKATFVISTEARDRHGTVIKLAAWRLDNYNNNGIVAYMHETSKSWWSEDAPDPDYIIAKGRAWVEDGQLMGEAEFEPAEINPLAEKIYGKVKFGSLKATSVGFKSHKGHWGVADDGEDTGTYYFDDVELLEFSIVNIPSNPEALKRFLESRKPNAVPADKENGEKLKRIIPLGLAKSRLALNQNF